MIIAAYFFVIILCFFLLFILCRRDFVLLRQNISLSQSFDAAFVSLASSFILGRSFYVVNNLKSDLLSILSFFHIFKYPGISIFGALVGGIFCLYLIFMKKKGAGRILDIFSISFFPLAALSVLFEKFGYFSFLAPVLFVVLLVAFVFFVYSHNKYVLRDGSITAAFLFLLALTTLLSELLSRSGGAILGSFTLLAMLSVATMAATLFVFILNQAKKNS